MNRLSAHFTVSILACCCLFAPNAAAQTIDFSRKKFEEPLDVGFWKRQIQDTLQGVEIDDTSDVGKYFPRVIFRRHVDFSVATFNDTDYFRVPEGSNIDRAGQEASGGLIPLKLRYRSFGSVTVNYSLLPRRGNMQTHLSV
ncbi:MAG TPA: hypothetical protein VN285_12940 [Candidatus Deferrimicrobium sp.]|nr:hypothetical protein [Candidatus Deferrimicrobium sp.]